MRQVGTLASERDAQRFAAWLVTQEIDAHAEREDGAWNIWVRDEDKLPQAKQAFTHFQAQPNDPQYANAEKLAEAARRQIEVKREQLRRNTVEMRDRWGKTGPGATRRSPMVLLSIGLSVVVFLLTYNLEASRVDVRTGAYRLLAFRDPGQMPRGGQRLEDVILAPTKSSFAWDSIRAGELWRLVTPALLHFSIAHLFFNMYWMYMIGGPIETRYGTPWMLLLMLLLAVTSNVGQALATGPYFGGMSGVGYGVFGFAWMRSKFDPNSNLYLDRGTVFIGMLWFILCILADIPQFEPMLGRMTGNVANVAHTVGLLMGVAIGFPWYRYLGHTGREA